MTSILIRAESIPECMSGANFVIPAQIYDESSCGQANFLEFWVIMAKITLKVKVNDPYFQYQSRISHDACLVQV